MNGVAWKREDLKRLFALHEQHGPIWKDIVAEFPGRTAQSLASTFRTHRDPKTGKLRSHAADTAANRPDADARAPSLPQHRTITAALLGDPPPGRSALDRMRASSAGASA